MNTTQESNVTPITAKQEERALLISQLEEEKQVLRENILDRFTNVCAMVDSLLNDAKQLYHLSNKAAHDEITYELNQVQDRQDIIDAFDGVTIPPQLQEAMEVAKKKVDALNETVADQNTWMRISHDHFRQGANSFRKLMNNPGDF